MSALQSETLEDYQNDDSDQWAERGDYWHNFNTETKVRGRKPRFMHQPLILSGHGIKIRIDRGALLIRNGFTHYPQPVQEYRFFPRDRLLPSRIIVLNTNGAITFDALEWLTNQSIPLVQINWRGEVVSTASGIGYAADLEILRAQLAIQETPAALSFACYLIEHKIENSIDTIRQIFAPSPAADATIDKLEKKLISLQSSPPSTVGTLLGAEGLAALTYFQCWHSHPLRWKGIGKKPIPDDWHRIGARMTRENSNQFAAHPVNAMLNYAYGMLENQVRTMILAMGFDPTIGVLHSYQRNRPTLVLDIMEPLRPVIDRKILRFVLDQTFSPGDFIISAMGVCKLHPQLAKIIVKLAQDIPERDSLIITSLSQLLEPNQIISKRALKNHAQFVAKAIGKRA